MTTLRAGTRASELARTQTENISNLLRRAGLDIEIVYVKTKGDKAREARFSDLGPGIFTRALDEALLNGTIDFAVHSAKDVPTDTPEEIGICAFSRRASPRDAIVFFKGAKDYDEIPPDGIIGTSSTRRKALLLNIKPGLEIRELRGNVRSRLKKAEEAEFEGAVLAMAGLERLGLKPGGAVQVLDPHLFVPAPGQGSLAVACLKQNPFYKRLQEILDDPETRRTVVAERSFLECLGGGCQVPAGAYAEIKNREMKLFAVLLSPGGSECIRIEKKGAVENGRKLGEEAFKELFAKGGESILRDFNDTISNDDQLSGNDKIYSDDQLSGNDKIYSDDQLSGNDKISSDDKLSGNDNIYSDKGGPE